jgi:UDP:flavonoid glycosyltransferase YjiC (YdhE family)
LSRDGDELWSREVALARLSAPADRPVVLVVAAGRPSEVGEMGAIATRLHRALQARAAVRLATLASQPLPISSPTVVVHWPLLELLGGVDLVVGAGGYNTVHECRATKRPLLAFAQPRMYDRQQRRLQTDEQVSDVEDLLRRVELQLARPPVPPPRYENGTHRAVAAIGDLSSG